MSIPLCQYPLPSGRRCRGPARAGFRFCRHHTPEVLRRHPVPFVPAPPFRPQPLAPALPAGFSRIGHWRSVRSWIARASEAEFPTIVEQLLRGFERNCISHRCAGALLDQVSRRRRYLRMEALLLRTRTLAPNAGLTDELIAKFLSLCR